MEEEIYFNPYKANHVYLLEQLSNTLGQKGDQIAMVKYGPKTQHIFRNNRYLMTLNWNLL